MGTSRPNDILIQRLELVAHLDDQDREVIQCLRFETKVLDQGIDIVRAGDVLDRCCLVMQGSTARYHLVPDGDRQIVAFHVAGDIPDLQSLHIKKMDHSLATIAPSEIAFVSHEQVWASCIARPSVAAALWLETLIDAAIYREWIVGLGQYSALQRTARLLCELVYRMDVMQLGTDGVYGLKLTQFQLGEALGLTVVSVNRSLQSLRAEKAISWSREKLHVYNWERLRRIGIFDPGYLHILPTAIEARRSAPSYSVI